MDKQSMYVCLCKAVTDSDIQQAVGNGVRSMSQLARETGCSSNCGRCARTAFEVLGEALQDANPVLNVISAGSSR